MNKLKRFFVAAVTTVCLASAVSCSLKSTISNEDVYCNVTFEPNGGNFSDGGISAKVVQVKKNDRVEEPSGLFKEGYFLNGWKNNGVEWDFNESVKENITLVADWNIGTYMLDISFASGSLSRGTVTGRGSYEYGSPVTITATPNDGYIFEGWFVDSALVSELPEYSFDMPSKNIVIEVRFGILSYKISLSNNCDEVGKVSGGGTYYYMKTVKLTATAFYGCPFDGWYEGDKKLSSDANYSFLMPARNMSIYAKWVLETYNLTIENNNTEGIIVGPESYLAYSSITISIIPNPGYKIKQLFLKTSSSTKTIKADSNSIAITMPAEDCTISSAWENETYTLTVRTDDGNCGNIKVNNTIEKTYSIEMKYLDYIYINALPFTGYVFSGWYEDDVIIADASSSYKVVMPSHDLTLTAKWSFNSFKLTLVSSNELMGSVFGSGNYEYMSEVTVEARTIGNYLFDGWYNYSSKVSSEKVYTFTMPNKEYELTAKFYDFKETLGQTPILSETKYLTYGLYPTTVVSNSELISALDEITECNQAGYYYYNGEYYDKIVATPYTYSSNTKATFVSNGQYITAGKTYWFHCTPIKWRILTTSGNDYFVTSNDVLDWQKYNSSSETQTRTDYQGNTADSVYANNYKYSTLRSWLNTTFYNKAFYLDDDNIPITEVDNSAVVTTSYSNICYACEDTDDKVFALREIGYLDTRSGYVEIKNRDYSCAATDYALAKGASRYYYKGESVSYYYTEYWIREPSHYGEEFVNTVGCNSSGNQRVTIKCGIRPAMHIILD